MPKSWTSARAKVAALSRDREDDDPELIEARRDMRALRLEDHVSKVLSGAPPLSAEQRQRIASLLSASGDAA